MDKIFFYIDQTNNNLCIFKENNKSKFSNYIFLEHITEVHIRKEYKYDIDKKIYLKKINDYELFFNERLKEQIKDIIINYFSFTNNGCRGAFGITLWRNPRIEKPETAIKIYKSILKKLYKQYKSILKDDEFLKEYIEQLSLL